VSGTQPRPLGATEHTPARSGPAPVAREEFRLEEPSSFDKRLTPVVPASWPENEPPGAGATAQPEEPIGADATVRPEESTSAASVPPAPETTAVTPSQRSISISLTPSAGSEPVFWDTAPKYSVPPASLVSEHPLPPPSPRRARLTKLLFAAIVGVALGLLYYEASIAYHVPWQNPRLLVQRVQSR
jgi:hypothetical protein